jgi:hypothetical protein
MRSNPQNVTSAYSSDAYSIRIKSVFLRHFAFFRLADLPAFHTFLSQGRSSSQAMPPWKGSARFVRDTAAEVQYVYGSRSIRFVC